MVISSPGAPNVGDTDDTTGHVGNASLDALLHIDSIWINYRDISKMMVGERKERRIWGGKRRKRERGEENIQMGKRCVHCILPH